jgi:hypothetical protein
MKISEETLLLIAGAVCVMLIPVVFYFTVPRHGVQVYDCRIAEISPDIPLKVKEECRKLNIQRN